MQSKDENRFHRHSLHSTREPVPPSFLEKDNMVPLNFSDFGGSFGGFIINRFCPSCYQSEPTLATSVNGTDPVLFRGKPLTFETTVKVNIFKAENSILS